MQSQEWPEDKVRILALLAKDGFSARQISERFMASGFNVTRMAVLGKAHRLNIDVGIVSKAGYLQSTRFGRKGKPKNPINDYPPKEPLPARGLCQWPMGDTWCGCVVKKGAYCEEHKSVAYTGVPALTGREFIFFMKGN